MRKIRSTPAKRRTTTRSTARKTTRAARRKKSDPILIFDDLLGVGFVVLALVTLVALCSGESGILGQYIAASIRWFVGWGAFAVPIVLAATGVVLIATPLEIVPRNIGIGSGILFFTFITWRALAMGMDFEKLSSQGGYLGAVAASALLGIAGETGSYLILVGLGVIAILIIRNSPLATTIDGIQSAIADWRTARLERFESARDARDNKKSAKARAKVEKLDKSTEVCDEPEAEGRRRTLSSIFAKRAKSEEDEPEVIAEPVLEEEIRPPVKILNSMAPKPARVPKNGSAQHIDDDFEPEEDGEFILPPTSLLVEPPPPPPRVESELKENIEIIERTLEEFKVTANVVEIACGPTVARYEIRLAPGIKVNKIVGLADNLAMQLAAIDVRVEAPIPGKAAIGVEVPNRNRGMVVMREIVENKTFTEAPSKLAFSLGKDVAGNCKIADLKKMPHLLVGGATNAGKSVGLSALIMSFLYRAKPDELKLVLIDPKRVELSMFDGIPHLACPVVKDVKQAASVFRAVVQEMDRRYQLLGQVGSRNIDAYNEKIGERGERMPYMVVVVDELADLMMQCAAEVEGSICRLAQLARAVGIHLVIATQRPSVDVITGVIKANISSRIAFAVSSQIDSRTILDQKGAERLIGQGDMLFLPIDASKPTRIQGCYVSDKEIEDVCNFLKKQRKPIYTIQPGQASGGGAGGGGGDDDDAVADEFYEPSVRFVVNTGYCSTSMLQRKYKIGYTRAARIVDVMEAQGVVGPLDGAKPRQVLVSKADLEQIFGGHLSFPPPDEEDYDDDVPPAEIILPDDDEDEEE